MNLKVGSGELMGISSTAHVHVGSVTLLTVETIKVPYTVIEVPA